MFRISKSHVPYAFDVAAERILEGWKYAGQPIVEKQVEEENESFKVRQISFSSISKEQSSTNELLNEALNLVS